VSQGGERLDKLQHESQTPLALAIRAVIQGANSTHDSVGDVGQPAYMSTHTDTTTHSRRAGKFKKQQIAVDGCMSPEKGTSSPRLGVHAGQTEHDDTIRLSDLQFRKQSLLCMFKSCIDELSALDSQCSVIRLPVSDDTRPRQASTGKLQFMPASAGSQPQRKRRSKSLHDAFLKSVQKVRERRGLRVYDWRRDKVAVQEKIVIASLAAACFATIGLILAIYQNEYILGGGMPSDAQVNLAKLANSFCTLISISALFWIYSLSVRLHRITRHCRNLLPLLTSTTWLEVLLDPYFWLETVTIGIHCPPYVTYEFVTYSIDNIIMYRAETLGALVNSLRVYLIFRYLRARWLIHLPMRLTIQTWTGATLDTKYMFKVNLHGWNGIRTVILVWCLFIIVCGYWYRAAELQACTLPSAISPLCQEERAKKWILYGQEIEQTGYVDNYYLWHSLWLVMVTSLTVGYGDFSPFTYYGRVVAVMSVFIGLSLGSILTATVTNMLMWDPEEITFLRILERKKAKRIIRRLAAEKIIVHLRQHLRQRSKQSDTTPDAFSDENPGCCSLLLQYCRRAKSAVSDAMSAGEKAIERRNRMIDKLRRLQVSIFAQHHHALSDELKVGHLDRRTSFLQQAVEAIHDRMLSPPVLASMYRRSLKTISSRDASDRSIIEHTSEPQCQMRPEGGQAMVAWPSTVERMATKVKRLTRGQALSFVFHNANASLGGHQKSRVPDRKKSTENANLTRTFTFLHRHIDSRKIGEKEATRKSFKIKDESFQTKDVPHATRQNARCEQRQSINATLDRFKESASWKHRKGEVIKRLERARLCTAIMATLGNWSAFGQNELIITGSRSQEALDSLKLFNTVMSFFCILGILRIYWLQTLLEKLVAHVFNCHRLDLRIPWYQVLSKRSVWIEMVLVGVHSPPWFDYSFSVSNMGNIIVYRLETILCCFNFLRVYCIWRAFEDWLLSDIPERYTLAGFSGVKFGTAFAIKRHLHHWMGMIYVILVWFFSILWCGYLYRAAEMTACQFPQIEGGVPLHPSCHLPEAKQWSVKKGQSFEKVNDDILQVEFSAPQQFVLCCQWEVSA
jgi:hypothetical protein